MEKIFWNNKKVPELFMSLAPLNFLKYLSFIVFGTRHLLFDFFNMGMGICIAGLCKYVWHFSGQEILKG